MIYGLKSLCGPTYRFVHFPLADSMYPPKGSCDVVNLILNVILKTFKARDSYKRVTSGKMGGGGNSVVKFRRYYLLMTSSLFTDHLG